MGRVLQLLSPRAKGRAWVRARVRAVLGLGLGQKVVSGVRAGLGVGLGLGQKVVYGFEQG